MKSCFSALIVLLILLLIVIGIIGYMGFIPQISSRFGMNKPRDLGIRYTDVILDQVKNKVRVEQKILSPSNNPVDSISYMGKHKVKETFSSEELTALTYDRPWKYYPVSKTQIKINKDGTVEISGFLRSDRIPGYIMATGGSIIDISMVVDKIKLPKGLVPFYIKGTGQIKDNAVTIEIKNLEIGRLPIPIEVVNPNVKYIKTFIEERIDFVKGASVASLTFTDGKMIFTGTLPDLEGIIPEQ